MPRHLPQQLPIPLPHWLDLLDDPPHLGHFGVRQLHLARRPILFQSVRLGRAGDGDEALHGNPRECDLRCGAPLLGSELLHLADDGAVGVEVGALELGDWVM